LYCGYHKYVIDVHIIVIQWLDWDTINSLNMSFSCSCDSMALSNEIVEYEILYSSTDMQINKHFDSHQQHYWYAQQTIHNKTHISYCQLQLWYIYAAMYPMFSTTQQHAAQQSSILVHCPSAMKQERHSFDIWKVVEFSPPWEANKSLFASSGDTTVWCYSNY
jgi:hypothetical protein